MLLFLVMVSPYKGITVLLWETRNINQCLRLPPYTVCITHTCARLASIDYKLMLMLILVQSNTHIVSDLILMLHSSRARVTQGKIRGPDIIERLAPLKLLTQCHPNVC